jgi:hypothetical protein
VAEQLTEKMGHLRLPDESPHCRGQLRSGERPSRRQQSWFCDGTYAAAYRFAAARTVSSDGSVILNSTFSSRLSSSDASSKSPSPVSALRIMPVHVLAPIAAVAPPMHRSLERVVLDAFVLIATTNPCPCGYSGDPRRACS